MIAGLKPYAAVTESGAPGVGAVPLHWRVRKLRNVLSPVTERNRPDLPLLSVVRERGVILRDTDSKEENHNFIPDDLSNYKVVRAGQFAMNKMKAWQGSYGVSRYDGIVSPAYFTFGLNGVEGNFFHLAIRSSAYVPFFTQASDGVRVGQWDLSQSRMKEIPFLIPPPDEQATIVRFLDHADRRIRRAIAAKQKLIRLLEEQKRAIIHRAVTRGLDPDVRLKASGVEWIGDVPEHWEIRKLRSLFGRQGSGTTPTGDRYYDGSIPWVMSGDLNDAIVTTTKRAVTAEALLEVGALKLYPPRSLIVAMYGATIGKTGVLEMAACTNQACCVFSEHSPSVIVEFLQLVVNVARPALLVQSYGGGQPNINANVIKALRVPLPSLKEQVRIVEWTQQNTSSHAIEAAKVEISLLKEYLVSLVADVVSGKLDVREAAANLPEVIESQQSDGDADEYNEAETMKEDMAEDHAA